MDSRLPTIPYIAIVQSLTTPSRACHPIVDSDVPAVGVPHRRERGFAGTPSPDLSAGSSAPLENVGSVLKYRRMQNIEIRNLRDERLEHIQDLGIDLENGRIIEVLVESDEGLFTSGRIVAVPPLAFLPDPINRIYRLNISRAAFATAPEVDMERWTAADRSNRIAAAYRYFGWEPYFIERGTIMEREGVCPKSMLDYVERSSGIVDLPVTNLQHQYLGKVWNMRFSILSGRVLSVVVIAPGDSKTKSVTPSMALRFNDKRDGLLLDDSIEDFANEPQIIFFPSVFLIDSHFAQETYAGPRTAEALLRGSTPRDVDIMVRIHGVST